MSEMVEKKLLEYIEHTKDFVLEKAPELFKEILKFDTIAAYLGSLVCLSVMVTGIILSLKFYKIPYDKSYERPTVHMITWIGTAVIVPLLLIQTMQNISDIIQIKIAPKYYLLKKLK
jgi:hypothetical protein